MLVQDINHKPHDQRFCLRRFHAAYVEYAVLIEQLLVWGLLAREDVFIQPDRQRPYTGYECSAVV